METRLIFCWSPGRCGTKYLAKMLQTVPGIVARHEPPPRLSECSTSPLVFWDRDKLPAIEALQAPVYIETGHVFANGFLPALLGLGVMPDVVQITRAHRDVALSLWRRLSIPGRTGRGKQFLLEPDFAGWQSLTDYQLCYWHSQAIERRGYYYQNSVDRWVWLRFEDLVHGDGLSRTIQVLDLPEPNWRKYDQRRGWKVNGNPLNYYNHWPDGDLDAQEREIDALWS